MTTKLVNTDGTEIPYGFEVLLKPYEVAAIMSVNVATVRKWAIDGKLRTVLTAGGRRRFPEPAVRAALEGDWERARSGPPEVGLVFMPDSDA